MLAMLLFSLFGFGAVLAMVSMIVTWQQHASAWDALDAEMLGETIAPRGYVSVRELSGGQGAAPAPMVKSRVRPLAVRLRPGLRVAA